MGSVAFSASIAQVVPFAGAMDSDFEIEDEIGATGTELQQPKTKAKAKFKSKAKAKASSNGDEKGSRKAAKRKKYTYVCLVCMDPNKQSVGNNPYCSEHKGDDEALRADAIEQGKLESFERAKKDTELYRKLLLDYRARCASHGRGKARARYESSRFEEMVQQSHCTQKGGEGPPLGLVRLQGDL